ncbi:hypothetical protein PR202_ga14709 [Eleusine coracana subsp. coracana]|uniref:SKP1-like protein n=1 Tax=Eleusine coracana subsp. coracana TaxID=191504 RepID=A0AAV5CID2_ELECO|nr:hypothetical protein QOZ80_6BG0500980 [Eleusine coracana subsp. coracana]GJM97757.1 hypothetical protein PR202_ga14709 [Eleusine coracana subsp. coracana]
MAAAEESGVGGNNGAARMVTLISSDNARFEVDEAAASLLPTVHRVMIEGGGGDGIPLPEVDAVTLSKVLEYCIKHAPGDGGAAAVDRRELEVFDMEFVNIDQSMLCSLANAAYHLDVKGLVEITCQKVADMMTGKSPEQLRRIFCLPDPTPEEQAELDLVRQQNSWAFE